MSLGERFRSIRGILLLFAVIPVFWALFDQMTTTWVLLGGDMTASSLFGYPINTETMQNINPIFVMSLIPILSFLIYPALNRTRFFKTTPLRRMTTGMVLAALSFVICGWLQGSVDASLAAGTPTISVWWMALPYFVLTLGEVLFSATGLEFAFSQAPAAMRSTITSLWNLTTTVGNFLVVLVVAVTVNYTEAERFYLFAALMLAVAVVFGIFSAFYKYKNISD
jgi:POT family proton-dependent oligopeptide transporter